MHIQTVVEKNGQNSSLDKDFSSSRRRRQDLLPVAKPLYYDFLSYGQEYALEVTESGYVIYVPMATEVAMIERPKWFPSMPEIDSNDTEVREAVEGVHEVTNIFESLNPSLAMKNACVKCVRKMEKAFNEAAGKRDEIVHICENTTYELEALVGAIQIFGNKKLTDVPGALRVGAFLTFPWYSFEQNYNINFVMTRWIRINWCFPYPSHADMCKLTTKYNFDSSAILSWLDNARLLVWQPLSSMDWLERFDLLDHEQPTSGGGRHNRNDDARRQDRVLAPFQLPLKRLVQT